MNGNKLSQPKKGQNIDGVVGVGVVVRKLNRPLIIFLFYKLTLHHASQNNSVTNMEQTHKGIPLCQKCQTVQCSVQHLGGLARYGHHIVATTLKKSSPKIKMC